MFSWGKLNIDSVSSDVKPRPVVKLESLRVKIYFTAPELCYFFEAVKSNGVSVEVFEFPLSESAFGSDLKLVGRNFGLQQETVLGSWNDLLLQRFIL